MAAWEARARMDWGGGAPAVHTGELGEEGGG